MTFARIPSQLSLLAAVGLLTLACGDDSDPQESDAGGSSSGSTTDTTTSTTTDATTSTTSTTDPTTTTSATSTSTTSTGTDTETDTDTATTGGQFDCTDIPAAPFAATEVFADSPFSGSEDLAFDGAGNVVASGGGGDVLAVSADGQSVVTVATGVPAIYGIRYLTNGNLIAAAFQVQDLIELSTGTPVDYVVGAGGVNGVQPDFEGRIWVTNFAQVLLVDDTPAAAAVVDPAASANGIVYDADRGYILFTNYNNGDIRRAAVDNTGTVGAPEDVTNIPGTSPDGLALDGCGNLYAVDQGGNMVYRVFLDENAAAVGDPEELLDAQTASNIANAQFGVGDGWDEQTLYAIGVPGELYAIEVGVPGAPYPVPE